MYAPRILLLDNNHEKGYRKDRKRGSLRNNEGNSQSFIGASSSIVKMAGRKFFWRIDAARSIRRYPLRLSYNSRQILVEP